MNSKTFCVAPFIGVEFRKNGRLGPCCRYAYIKKDVDWNFRNYDQWWEEYLTPMREELLNGIEHTGCQNCWRDEQLGIKSYRESLNEEFVTYTNLTAPLPAPIHQMYNYGNFCNLKCIMCSPFASSQLETEFKQNKSKFNAINVDYQFTTEIKWFRTDEFNKSKQKLLPGAEQILIQGGEPFLSPDVLDLFREIQHPENVILTIISNMTTFTDEIVDLLSKFKHVRLVVSLEGVGKYNNYLRYGSEWDVIVSNIDKSLAMPNLDFSIAHTFQRTSLTCWIPIFKWALDRNIPLRTNILDHPMHLSVNGATAEEKNAFLHDAVELYNVFNNEYDTIMSDTGYKPKPEMAIRFQRLTLLSNLKSHIERFKTYVESVVYNHDDNLQFWRYVDLLDELRDTKLSSLFNTIHRPV